MLTIADVEEMYVQHARFIKTFLLKNLHVSYVDIDDDVQEVFLLALRGRESFKGGSQRRTWLCSIAKHYAYNKWAKIKSQKDAELEDAVIMECNSYFTNLYMCTSGAERDVCFKQQLKLASDYIAAMGSAYNDVADMIFVDGMEYQECADVLNIPVGTVRSRVNRIRRDFSCVFEGWDL